MKDQRRVLQDLRIMIVDDSPDILMVMKIILEEAGARIIDVRSMAEALIRFEGERPDLLMSDIELADGNGFQLFDRIRHMTSGDRSPLPIAALTGHRDEATSRRIAETGFDACFTKPFDPAELIRSIQEIMARERSS